MVTRRYTAPLYEEDFGSDEFIGFPNQSVLSVNAFEGINVYPQHEMTTFTYRGNPEGGHSLVGFQTNVPSSNAYLGYDPATAQARAYGLYEGEAIMRSFDPRGLDVTDSHGGGAKAPLQKTAGGGYLIPSDWNRMANDTYIQTSTGQLIPRKKEGDQLPWGFKRDPATGRVFQSTSYSPGNEEGLGPLLDRNLGFSGGARGTAVGKGPTGLQIIAPGAPLAPSTNKSLYNFAVMNYSAGQVNKTQTWSSSASVPGKTWNTPTTAKLSSLDWHNSRSAPSYRF